MTEENTPREKLEANAAYEHDVSDAEFVKNLIEDNSLEKLQKIELAIRLHEMGLRPSSSHEESTDALGARPELLGLQHSVLQDQLRRSRENIIESYKMDFEAYKSQNLLCSGALVVFTAITTGLLDDPINLYLLSGAYIALVTSIVNTTMIMHNLGSRLTLALAPHVRKDIEVSSINRILKKAHEWIGEPLNNLLSLFGFAGGLILFLLFLTTNLT
ncbi:MAG: hypothetical protein AVDCRST_MAG28-1977 [uncultured Rubrobacteraceae bacterium]|uniref:Uncharacterized protein n=1 Tax=uncultured Rubrobacteraceae bacterium TaxID=349277 RepID=A0A6J4R002_9ACTN|nr:MAG: hypothetical protein AVDCRST_MAG28-1977 [uncultured Rubrobacteraceae bacterium]